MAKKTAGSLIRSEEPVNKFLRFPVVSEGAEHLVMGHLMRRNILTYKAPPLNEGYDLICIHPNPRHRVRRDEKAQVRIQVKSRYQSDCDRGFPVNAKSINAFDYVVIVFLNIGSFSRGRDGSEGIAPPEFYALPRHLIRRLHDRRSSWHKVRLRGKENLLKKYQGELGIELIAKELGVERPTR